MGQVIILATFITANDQEIKVMIIPHVTFMIALDQELENVAMLRRYNMLQCSEDINCHNSQEIMCKLVGTSQATCVFLSSFSILLIAIDRYLFIVHPTWPQVIIVTIMVEMIIMVEICFPLSLLMQIDID